MMQAKRRRRAGAKRACVTEAYLLSLKHHKVVRERAEEWYYDLLHNKKEVILIPSEDDDTALRGGKIRVTEVDSPQWYKDFRKLYPKKQNAKRQQYKAEHGRANPRYWIKPRSAICRHATLRALLRLMRGNSSTLYAQRLLQHIERTLEREQSTNRSNSFTEIGSCRSYHESSEADSFVTYAF